MKQPMADRLIRMFLLLGATAALTHELCKAFLIPQRMTATLWPLLGLDAAVLLLLTLCVRTRRAIQLSLIFFFSAGIVLTIYACHSLSGILASPGTMLYPYLFYLIALPTAILSFYAAWTPVGTVILMIGGPACFGILSAIGYVVDKRAMLLFCLFSAALFLERRLPVFPKRARRLGILAAFLAASMLFSQLILAGLRQVPALQYTGLSRINALQNLFQGSFAGFSDNVTTKRLGGPFYRDDTKVLVVKGAHQFYLKGRTYTTYQSGSWSVEKQPETAAMRTFDSLHPLMGGAFITNRDWFRQYGGNLRNYADDLSIPSLYENLTAPVISHQQTLTVIPQQSGHSTLFLPLGFSGFQSRSIRFPELKNGSYLAPASIQAGNSYTVSYPEINTNLFSALGLVFGLSYNDLTTQFLKSMQQDFPEDYRILTAESAAAKADTALPSTITRRTRVLAKSITQNSTNALAAADAIRAWLFKNCTYKADVSMPSGAEFVDDFLFRSKKGYCVHFATAMTILLRAAGYPARYVEGYVSPLSDDSTGTVTVTNNQAHAWVEVYTPLLGYVREEATPGFGQSANTPGDDSASPGASESVSPSSAVSSAVSSAAASSKASSTLSTATGSSGKASGQTAAFPVWAIVLIALAVFALALAGKMTVRAVWLARLRRRNLNEQVLGLYAYCLRFFARLGRPRAENETPDVYARAVEQAFGFSDFTQVTAVYLYARYSGGSVPEADARFVLGFYRALPRKARRAKGWLAGFFAVLGA